MISLEEFLAAIESSGDDLDGVLRSSMERLRSDVPAELANILKRAHAGEIDEETARQLLWEVEAEGHGRATYLGRVLATGDATEKYNEFDIEFGKLQADGQQPYAEKFLSDVLSGSYNDTETGDLDAASVEARADHYNHALRGTGNEAWTNSLATDEVIIWVLGEEDDGTCSVCPSLAEDGPYTPGTMPTWPGAGETPCVFNCRCTIVTESGKAGF